MIALRASLPDADNLLDEAKSIVAPAASQVLSIKESVESEVPDVVSKVKSAVNSAATHLQEAIEQHVPAYLTLGTTMYCVGFIPKPKCNNLPLSLSDLVSKDLPDVVEKEIQEKLQPFVATFTNVASIRIYLIIAFVLVVICAMLFVVSMWNTKALTRRECRSRFLVHLILGIICCLPIFVVAVALVVFRPKATSLSAWIEVKHGQVGGLCFGALSCAMVLTLIVAISPYLIRKD
jgi:hypothetical protein